MRKYFLITFMIFLFLWASSSFSSQVAAYHKEAQIQQYDQQIQELEDVKRGYEAKALRHEDQADRLQFNDETYLETRRHIQLAEENRAKAAATQKEIDRLQAEKAKLLNQTRK